MLKLLFKNFWNFLVYNLVFEDISVVVGVGDFIMVCIEYCIIKVFYVFFFDIFYIFWYIKFYIKWEMNWFWFDFIWFWFVFDLILMGRLWVFCWWYLIGFRLVWGYRWRLLLVFLLSIVDFFGGKCIRSLGVRWKLDGLFNMIVFF